MQHIIETQSLSFEYKKGKKIIKDLNLKVPRGSIYGFLGPNGAGKSTTIALLTGAIPDRKNAIRVFDRPLNEQIPNLFYKIGAIIESPTLYLHLTGRENLKLICEIKKVDLSKVDELLDLVDLSHAASSKAKTYSLGMKQRLAIAMALVGDPELLFLDEPVNGLDPAGIVHVRNLLIRLNREKGTTVFISSHLLPEIEKLCTHVGIIHQGLLKFEGTMQTLKTRFSGHSIRIKASYDKEISLSKPFTITSMGEDELLIEIPNYHDTPELISELIQKGIHIYEVAPVSALEDWFFNLTDKV